MSNLEVICTSKYEGDRFARKDIEKLRDKNSDVSLKVFPDKECQDILGFGGAFTEASAYSLAQLNSEKRNKVVKSFFAPDKGLDYSFCRTHMGSCDFSLDNYSHCGRINDNDLKSFSIERDKEYLLPHIKDALDVKGSDFKILASPWSPPAWMKTNGERNHGGRLLKDYQDSWALYFSKFIEAYKNEGVDLWGVTVQNEPVATQEWDSCIYNSDDERIFVRDYLGPKLEERGQEDIDILVWDHNRDLLYQRAKSILSDEEAAEYISGVAFHWYQYGDYFENVRKTHEEFPDKLLVQSEASTGGVGRSDWENGEYYAHNIMGDLNNGASAWVHWNLVLNQSGGPRHAGGESVCDAPIMVDSKRNKVSYRPSYYFIGHFSKYIEEGATRIGFETDKNCIEISAFKNPDGKKVIVILNSSEDEISYNLKDKDVSRDLRIPPRSIETIRYY